MILTSMLDDIKKELQKNGRVVIEIKARADSSCNKILEDKEEIIKIAVKARAEKGEANKELVRFLAKIFQTDKDNIKIITGKISSKKKIKIINR
jgi:uncharacterized protein (TIGR00251 family)